MRKIKFRGQDYDAELLARMAPFGRMETADTCLVSYSFAGKVNEPKTAILLDGKYHLLTGAIDPTQPKQTLKVFSKVALKKALIVEVPHNESSRFERTPYSYGHNHGW